MVVSDTGTDVNFLHAIDTSDFGETPYYRVKPLPEGRQQKIARMKQENKELILRLTYGRQEQILV
jgi:hypothetical protein